MTNHTDKDNGSNTLVATAVRVQAPEEREETLIPGELKWTSDTADNTEVQAHEETKEAEKITVSKVSPLISRRGWIWLASLSGVFFTSFFIGYTVLGNQYWREVFDIHMWIHMLKLLFA